ncbi:MAG: NAD(P)/FAD-dependent oxidoreductase [Paracoccaceae bacterium]
MDHEFLIIGGGIGGVSAAATLSALGRVLLVEAEDHLAYHASGRSAAMYEPRYGRPAVVELSLASGDLFRSLPGLLSDRGLMVLCGPGEEAALAADAAAMHLTPISVAEARAMVPILNPAAVTAAAYSPEAWDIDTDMLLQHFAKIARGNGAQIVTGARVTALTRDGTGWRADWTSGSTTARIVVNAAGAWADTVAAMAGITPLRLIPHRRSMARLPAPGGHDVSTWPMIFGAGETWYAKPDAGALIVSPADEDPTDPHDAWADDMVLAEGLARYEAMVTEPVTRLLSNWAGLRTFSPDRVPVIGMAPAAPGFFWLAGQGGYGFQSSAAAARLAADLIGGTRPALPADLVAALSPARFF